MSLGLETIVIEGTPLHYFEGLVTIYLKSSSFVSHLAVLHGSRRVLLLPPPPQVLSTVSF